MRDLIAAAAVRLKVEDVRDSILQSNSHVSATTSAAARAHAAADEAVAAVGGAGGGRRRGRRWRAR